MGQTCFIILLSIFYSISAFAPDEIKSLPGWHDQLPSRQYSGYLNANIEKTWHVHYWFTECERGPDAPVVWWFNGGPGFSSIYGYLTEMGQFLLNDLSFQRAGQDGLKLFYNPYSWTQVANVLIFEFPPGVGYSYCDTPDICNYWNDTMATEINFHGLLDFYQKFPNMLKQPLYMAGESYAGIYLPLVATAIVEYNRQPQTTTKLPLAGLASGNGCTGGSSFGPCGRDGAYWTMDFIAGHQGISRELEVQLRDQCSEILKDHRLLEGDANCKALMDKLTAQSGGFSSYNFYDECWGAGSDLLQIPTAATTTANNNNNQDGTTTPQSTTQPNTDLSGERDMKQVIPKDHYSCGAYEAIKVWLNQPNVKQALNVRSDLTWSHNDGGWNAYHSIVDTVVPLYENVLIGNLKILIYEGDLDIVAPVRAAEELVNNFNLGVTDEWHPWTMAEGSNVIYGWVQRYNKNVDLIVIKGAGHMVMSLEPMHGLAFLGYWLNNTDWPRYTGPGPSEGAPAGFKPSAYNIPFAKKAINLTAEERSSPLWAVPLQFATVEQLLHADQKSLNPYHISMLQQEVLKLQGEAANKQFWWPFLVGIGFAVYVAVCATIVVREHRKEQQQTRYTVIP